MGRFVANGDFTRLQQTYSVREKAGGPPLDRPPGTGKINSMIILDYCFSNFTASAIT
jgi:hypothetical protein